MKIMDPPQERVALLSSDEGGGSTEDGCSGDSSEDEVTEHRVAEEPPLPPPARPPPPYMQPSQLPNMAAQHAQVPIISVTPHSPGVLDDSLQQLRRLHAAVQRMRTAPLPQLIGSNRLSTSCPTLVKDGELGQEDCYSPSATPSHLDYYPHSRKGSGESRHWAGWDVGGDEGRRRSWAALEPVPRMGEVRRQRSMSLSSMESDGELESVGGVPGVATARRSRQAQSTHSLNEADLQKDFAAVALALRSGLGGGAGGGGSAVTEPLAPPTAARALPARLQPRLPLQKSVSTPSIVAAVQPALQPTTKGNDLSVGGASDTESEEEDDTSATTVGGSAPGKASALVKSTTSRRSSKHPEHLGLHQLEFLAQTSYDHHSEKRRKRGSLFFRKKKDKSRKASHIWQAANAGGDCDWCGRVLSDKPSLYCENCTTTVHQNICKDYIVECTKPKTSKTSVTKSLSTNSGKNSKRSSLSNQPQTASTYVNHDDKEGSDHRHDQSNVSDDAMGAEWPEACLTADQLGVEAGTLSLGAPEPDTWGAGAPRALARTLTEREQKRQEHIYELVLTEKHHCLTVRLMQKMFLEGMVRGAGVSSAQGARMFPRLADLWSLHAALLLRLRQRQAASPNVPTISDILLDNFTGATAAKFKSAYGEFCSRHRDAVDVFKDCCAREPKVARFIRKCQTNPLLRKKGVPECVLFVAQRLTKYPLLLEPLLKTAGDDQLERERLQRALAGVKEILVDVDGQVAAKEREDRKLEIYHRIDAKSFAIYRGRKFKKSDILQGNRSLKFEGTATLMQGRSKMQSLLVIVLTDCLFFLHDNNNKYTFFTPDNKTGVVSLQKLLVREKAGAEGRGLYIICSSPSEPEMFELRVHKPKDLAHWITPIRAAVQCCPEDEEDPEVGVQSAEERQKQLEAREKNITMLTGNTPYWQLEDLLRSKDKEHALLLEDKMGLHMRLVGAVGSSAHGGHVAAPPPSADMAQMGLSTAFLGGLVPEYMKWAIPSTDTHALWQEVCKVVKEAMDVCAAAWGAMGAAGAALGRSTSSAGERHSQAYESPALPRRAETFGGFDNQHTAKVRRPTDEDSEKNEQQATAEQLQEQQQQHLHPQLEPHAAASLNTALKLQHCIYTLTCIVWQQLTSIHSLEAQMWASRGGSGSASGAGGVLQQLEELREAQARLTQERAAWDTQRQADADALAAERRMLSRATQQLSEQQRDVEQQRERLYRRLERLQQQQHGGSQEEVASVGTLSPESSITDNGRRKDTSKWRASRGSTGSECSVSSSVPAGVLPPPQLLSAQNERRAAAVGASIQHIPLVKQQLPLKLASGKSQASHTQAATLPPAGYQRLHDSAAELNSGLVIHHTRTGSSPANISHPHTQQINNKATRTNTYPKLPDKFRVRSPESQGSAPHTPQPQHQHSHAQDEEVIFF